MIFSSSAILATQAGQALSGTVNEEGKEGHHSAMLEILAKEIGCDVGNICDFELCLADCQEGVSSTHVN